jgi:tetratricopeptide (TPR) repeat protein
LASQQRALAIKARVYGEEHHEVAMTLGNLGNVQRALGRFEEALASQQRALAIEERVYGEEHHEVAMTLGNLGLVQLALGRFEEALASLQRALAIEERVYGEEHHEVASTLGNLGNVQLELGQPGNAEAGVRRALAIFQAQLPHDHPHTRLARQQLAQLVAARGEVLLNISDDASTSSSQQRPEPGDDERGPRGPGRSNGVDNDHAAGSPCWCGSGRTFTACHGA